jgi:phosphoglycolate phosphatase
VERHPELALRYRHHYLARDPEIPLFTGARELLDELCAEGFLIAVATGKTRVGLDRALAANGLAARFHATRCADEGRPKPHPDMLLHLMARFDVPPKSTLMIGDTTHDLELARAAGADAVAVAYGAHEPDGLAAARPLATVHSVPELRAWLRRHG